MITKSGIHLSEHVYEVFMIIQVLVRGRFLKIPHWDDSTTKDLVVEGWDSISMDFINEKCSNMPRRLKDVIDLEGKMTGH